jgi:2-hydroxymuconate-semialdehyde hydrolase
LRWRWPSAIPSACAALCSWAGGRAVRAHAGAGRSLGLRAVHRRHAPLLDTFAYDRSIVNDELARCATRPASARLPGIVLGHVSAPRQRWVDALASREDIRRIPHETLIVHGREDRVIPLANSITLSDWIARSQLHVYGHCGHWTQIEHSARFARLVADFLAEADADEPHPLAD